MADRRRHGDPSESRRTGGRTGTAAERSAAAAGLDSSSVAEYSIDRRDGSLCARGRSHAPDCETHRASIDKDVVVYRRLAFPSSPREELTGNYSAERSSW